jgi:hypothetical protein
MNAFTSYFDHVDERITNKTEERSISNMDASILLKEVAGLILTPLAVEADTYPQGRIVTDGSALYMSKAGGVSGDVDDTDNWIRFGSTVKYFTDLLDAFPSYAGLATFSLRVNESEDGIEAFDLTTQFSQIGHTHVAADITNFSSSVNSLINAQKGIANGLTPLNSSGKIDVSYLPDDILGNLTFGGTYNGTVVTSEYPALNGNPLPDPEEYPAYYFVATDDFEFEWEDYVNGDWILSNGIAGYSRVGNSDAVTTVFGRNGNVIAVAGDYTTDLVTEATNLYFTNARARSAISATVTGLTYTPVTGVLSLTSGYVIPTTVKSGQWDSAYNNMINANPTFLGGTLTFAQQDTTTLTVSLDGRYLLSTSYTAADVLAKLLTVDGSGTGLDADLLDGQHGSYFVSRANHTGSQLANTISNFTAAARGTIDSTITAIGYDESSGTFNLADGYIIPTANTFIANQYSVEAATSFKINGRGYIKGLTEQPIFTLLADDGTEIFIADNDTQKVTINDLYLSDTPEYDTGDFDFLVRSGGQVQLVSSSLSGVYYTKSEIDDFFAGVVTITGYNNTDWDEAYDNMIVSASFNTSNGVITLTQQDAGTVTVDIDGRYSIVSGTANYIPIYNGTGTGFVDSPIRLSGSNLLVAETTFFNDSLFVNGGIFQITDGDFIIFSGTGDDYASRSNLITYSRANAFPGTFNNRISHSSSATDLVDTTLNFELSNLAGNAVNMVMSLRGDQSVLINGMVIAENATLTNLTEAPDEYKFLTISPDDQIRIKQYDDMEDWVRTRIDSASNAISYDDGVIDVASGYFIPEDGTPYTVPQYNAAGSGFEDSYISYNPGTTNLSIAVFTEVLGIEIPSGNLILSFLADASSNFLLMDSTGAIGKTPVDDILVYIGAMPSSYGLQEITDNNSITTNSIIAGRFETGGQIESTIITGTSPFIIASTTKVDNLNADLLDGLSAADFQLELSGPGIVKSIAGTISYITDNSSDWNTAYSNMIASASFNTSNGIVTLTQQDSGTVTVDIDGRFPLFDGTGATGTWAVDITGNADTVTDGIYTYGSYSNPSWITGLAWSKITGTPTTLSGYGITDALLSSAIAGTAGTIAMFGSGGDDVVDSVITQSGGNLLIGSGGAYNEALNIYSSTTYKISLQHPTGGYFALGLDSSGNALFYNGGSARLLIDASGSIITHGASNTGEDFIIGGSTRIESASDYAISVSNSFGNRVLKLGVDASLGESAIQATLNNGTAYSLYLNPEGGQIITHGASGASGYGFIVGSGLQSLGQLNVLHNIASDNSAIIQNTSATGYGAYFRGGVSGNYALQVTDYAENILLNLDGGGDLILNGNIDISGAITLSTPTTSSGTYSLLSWNTSTGVIEKITPAYLPLTGGTLTDDLIIDKSGAPTAYSEGQIVADDTFSISNAIGSLVLRSDDGNIDVLRNIVVMSDGIPGAEVFALGEGTSLPSLIAESTTAFGFIDGSAGYANVRGLDPIIAEDFVTLAFFEANTPPLNKNYGEVYFQGNSTDTTLTVNTPVVITATYTLGLVNNFTLSSGNNGLLCTIAGTYRISASFNVRATDQNNGVGSIAVDGSVVAKSKQSFTIKGAFNTDVNLSVECIVELEEGSEIQAYIENISGNADFLVRDLNITAIEAD